mgnify:CR=1 FL=1|jgi:hypothetical protein
MGNSLITHILCAVLLLGFMAFLFREICHARAKALMLAEIDDLRMQAVRVSRSGKEKG